MNLIDQVGLPKPWEFCKRGKLLVAAASYACDAKVQERGFRQAVVHPLRSIQLEQSDDAQLGYRSLPASTKH